MLEFLSNKVAGLKASNFIRKRLQHRYFPENIVKFLGTTQYWASADISSQSKTQFGMVSTKKERRSGQSIFFIYY